jgi:hypothetical protein
VDHVGLVDHKETVAFPWRLADIRDLAVRDRLAYNRLHVLTLTFSLGCERARDRQSNTQIMIPANPALPINSHIVISASIGAPPIPTSSSAIDYHSKRGKPDWELP